MGKTKLDKSSRNIEENKRKKEDRKAETRNKSEGQDKKLEPILRNSTIKSESKVSFDLSPNIKMIECSDKPQKKSADDIKKDTYRVNGKKLILNIGMKSKVKEKAKKYSSMITIKNKIYLTYKSETDMDIDIKALGFRTKTYMENKLIVLGLGYKETEESVHDYFSKFGKVIKVKMEMNDRKICTGKAIVSFEGYINTNRNFSINGRLLRIERIKKQKMNATRLYVSHMNKKINRSKLREVLKKHGFIAKNIRIDLSDNKRNKGYGFIEFERPDVAERFMEYYPRCRNDIGEESYIEYSKEKM